METKVRYFWAVTAYTEQARSIVTRLKNGRAREAGVLIGSLMAESCPSLSLDTVVVPVPTALSSVRARGYDHTAILARTVSRKLTLQYAKVLARYGQRNQITLHAPKHIAGRHVLLVDDVVIDGASIEEAARLLREAGAKTVDVLVFAQA